MKTSPFKFLDSFTKEDKDIFFGREKEVEEIYSRVFQSNLLLVYGASGTGKTSLIQCGLANKFNDSDWLPIIIRRGNNINDSLKSHLNQLAITPIKESHSLKKSIQSLYLDHFKPLYLIFDQFEELFIFGKPDEIKTFVSDVASIIKSDLQCKFIFVIRGEYLQHLTVFEDDLPEFFNNRIRIEKMTRSNAAEAVIGPCSIANIKVEEGFAQNFLEKLSPDKAEVELTYLQVFLDKLYKKAIEKNPSEPEFSNQLLDQLGKISDVLSDFLEEQIAKIPDSETAITVLKSFVSLEGTKKQMNVEEIEKFAASLGKIIPKDKVEVFLHQFVDLRILRDKDESGNYELRHDSLATKIYEKITIVEKELIEVRALIETSYKNYLKRKLFINEEDLKYITPYKDKLFLNEEVNDFLESSIRQVNKIKRRRRNMLIVIVSFLFVTLSGFTLWALKERTHALELANEAKKQTLLAEQQTNEALQANKKVEEEKFKAQQNEKLALIAKQQAEVSKQEAVAAKGVAEREKLNAQQQAVVAKKEKINADSQKEIAKSEKLKAEESEKIAKKGFMLSLAQGVALKVPLYKNDPQLQGLLALQAYTINKNNGGQEQDPIIFDALRHASNALNNNKKNSISWSSESRDLFDDNDTLVFADRDGSILAEDIRNFDEKKVRASVGFYDSPIDMLCFSPNGKQIVTSHDNYTVCLWHIESKGKPNAALYGTKVLMISKQKALFPPPQELKGHKGLVRSICFSPDASHIATAGKDSLILIWKIENGKTSLERSLKSDAAIKSIIYSSTSNQLFSLQENGKVIRWDIGTSEKSEVNYTGSSKPSCIALNKKNNSLLIGLSNGNIRIQNLDSDKYFEVKAHTASIDYMVFSKNFSLFATAGSDRKIKIYTTENLEENPLSINNLNTKVKSIIFTGDGKLIAACTDKNIYIIETSAKKITEEISRLLKRNMTTEEWIKFYKDLPYEKTKKELP